jgi:hypothetical protein
MSRNATGRAWREIGPMTGGSIPAFAPPVFTAVRSVRCAPPGPQMFRSSRRPRRPKRRVSVPAFGAGLRPLRFAAHGSAAGRQLKERCGLLSRTAYRRTPRCAPRCRCQATNASVHSSPASKSREGGKDRTGAAGQTVHRRNEPANDRDRDAGGLWQSTPVQFRLCRSLRQTADCNSAHTATGH